MSSTVSVGASNALPTTGLPPQQSGIPNADPAAEAPSPANAVPLDPSVVKQPESDSKPPSEWEPPKPYYDFDVKMSCGSCSGAVDKVLKKIIEKPNDFSVSLKTQRVQVWGPTKPAFEDVKAKIAKTGKQIVEAKVVQ